MIAAVTLLPALLGLAGTQNRQAVDPSPLACDEGRQTRHCLDVGRITSAGTRSATRPSASSPCVRSLLPVSQMRIGIADDSNAATTTTQRKAYDLLAAGFGKGFNGPIVAVVQTPTDQATGSRQPGCTTH